MQKKIKKILIEALHTSGKIINTNIRKKKSVTYKGAIDLLTKTDQRVEKIITRIIKEHFPTHIILGEESGLSSAKSAVPHHATDTHKWIIDPIDGTTNFYHSFPQVSTSIAVEKDNKIIFGGVYNPVYNELFFAEDGKGASLNGKKIRVSTTPKLQDTLLATGFPYDRRKFADYYLRFFKAFMMKCHGIRRSGSAALDFCSVACGRIDGFWELKLHPWDVAAGSLIVKEAGGKVTDFSGNSFNVYGTETLATNGKVHKGMKNILEKLKK